MKATIEEPCQRMVTLEMTQAEAETLRMTMYYLNNEDIHRGTGSPGVALRHSIYKALCAIL